MKTRKKLLILSSMAALTFYIGSFIGKEPSVIDQTDYRESEWNQEVSQKADQLRNTTSSWERKELKDEIRDLAKQAPVYYPSGSQ
ncbi:hypothetical protein WAX78_00685 [Bacillus sp. FJAT-53711]|uniref:Uncharacterized protein n=1 Tax=Bacillus yunxiaonensis TaxID=3127665 RepID=A0ABU8FPT7_9BACI